MKSLDSKTVFVSGASSGLGCACAKLAESRGARLVLIGRRPELLRELFPDERHAVYKCDVASEESVRALMASLKGQSLSCNGWVLAAGAQLFKPLALESHRSLMAAWASNVYGSLGLLGAALKARLVEDGASVVLFSSAAAHVGGPGIAAYAATKAALEGATRSLALELAGKRIRVNALAAGIVRTHLTDTYLSVMTPDQFSYLERQHALGFGTPEDVAGPVAFLLSDDARWITGTVLSVDGGWTGT